MSNFDLLFKYSEQGNNEELKKIIADGTDIHALNPDGENALILAAKNGHANTVQILLDAGAYVYSTNKYGHNTLIIAAMRCHSDVVGVILKHTKKVSQRTNPSVVAVMAANSLEATGCNDVADMLRNNPG